MQIGHPGLGGGLVQQLSHQEVAGMEADSMGRAMCPPRHCGVPVTARMEAEAGQGGVQSTWDNPWPARQGLCWLPHSDRRHWSEKR